MPASPASSTAASAEGCVLVTGAGGGIGEAVSSRFLDEGHRVVGADDPKPQERDDRRFLAVGLDVRSRRSQDEAVASAVNRFGSIDVLVTHAFVGVAETFDDITPDTWREVMETNLRGAMFSIQAALPTMDAGGSIVITSSIAGRRYSSVMGAHYTVARYGLIGLGRHLAAEMAGTGIRVNVVCPGPPNTPQMWQVTTAEEREQIAARTPLRRLAEPADVAELVFFLSSPEARHMHGAVVDINGGIY